MNINKEIIEDQSNKLMAANEAMTDADESAAAALSAR